MTRAGYAYNLPQPIDPPFAISGDVVVTAWKLAESGEGWILRVQNAGAGKTQVGLALGTPYRVTRVNLLEQPLADAVNSSAYRAAVHKHGILTLLIQPLP